MNHSHLQIGMETLFRIQINLWNIGMKFWYLRRDTWMNRNTNVLCPPNCWLLAPRIIIDAMSPATCIGSQCLSVSLCPHPPSSLMSPIFDSSANNQSPAGQCSWYLQNMYSYAELQSMDQLQCKKIRADFSPVYFTWKSNRLTLPIQHSNVQLLTHMRF